MNRGIGKVVYTDIYKRENTDKDSSYKFAFINIKLFETETANEFLQSIQKSPINVFYDSANEDNYWVVKMHLERDNRESIKKKEKKPKKDIPTKIKSTDILVNTPIISKIPLSATAKSWIPRFIPTLDTFDHYSTGLEMEYNELEREIYQMCCVKF